VDIYGHDPRACDASSLSALETRYKVLSEVCNLDGLRILEVGCGFGDLGVYLRKKFPTIRYVGIDLSSRMVEEARRCHPDLEFRLGNVLELNEEEHFDVVMAQGVFYLLCEKPEEKAQALIQKMFSLSTKAVAFSAISSWATRKTAEEFYMNPSQALDWCGALTSSVVLRHDYLPNDVAVYLYKP
jgi:trans-aconitate methyltransferase